ncbi:MAG: radical SAM protein, partial [Clostridiales bacterium]|nr:radical SAM protein [Clostridiales bacterium]
MNGRTIKESVQAYGIGRILKTIRTEPESSLPRLMEWADRIMPEHSLEAPRKMIRSILDDPDSPWHTFIMSLWSDIDDGCRETFFSNFIINSAAVGFPRQERFKEENGCNVPWAILMDPTSACNLKCKGCWAAEYGDQLNMSCGELDSIITQGKEMGTFMYIYSGGEPLVRKKDIISLCEKHSECMLLAFTNGILIDEAFAGELLRAKTFVPAISIEGDRA